MSASDQTIYLDNNATTAIDARVVEAMSECYQMGLGNPASQHASGRRAQRLLDDTRERIILLLGVKPQNLDDFHLIFTSGGTEANNLALFGLAGDPPGNIVISTIEHPSVMAAAERLATQGFEIRRAAVDAQGVLNLSDFETLLDDQTTLASVMSANNETGVVQPVAQIAELCRERKISFHTDAVQAVGKESFSFAGFDAVCFSAHKFHGPRGVGGLLVRSELNVEPMLYGGFQQAGLRPGTEPVALPLGMLRALELANEEADDRAKQIADAKTLFDQTILEACPCAQLIGSATSTSNISFVGLDRQAILMALDVAGVACSTGSACASGSSEPSHVLIAMGLAKDVVEGSIRFSFCSQTTVPEIADACRRIINVINTLRPQK